MYKGIGLRPPHYQEVLKNKPPVDFFEVISENFMDTGGRPLHILEKVRADYPIATHGVSLNIGSTDPVNPEYLKRLKVYIDRIQPSIVSDHLCWTGAHQRNWHDLLPLPMTEESAKHIITKVDQVQNLLGRKIALENTSTYLCFKDDEMSEPEFISKIVKQADCEILLDVNNIYVNSINHDFDPYEYVKLIPAQNVVQYHMAGHSDLGNFLFDTHDAPIIEPVWDLFHYTIENIGERPFIIERDDHIPAFAGLLREADTANEFILRKQSKKELAHELSAAAQ